MKKGHSITSHFGENLAELLAEKISAVYPEFDGEQYIYNIKQQCAPLSYTQRINLHAKVLHDYLPANYTEAIAVLMSILGEENPNETGMFSHYYWVMPIGKFVEIYGLENFDVSMNAIGEMTKRNTGEYAVRPFIRAYPEAALTVMKGWAKSPNFHLRRLASEGLRPKLPWSTKLDVFIEKPQPVFDILELLKADNVKFVQKSVANHLTDYLKVNQEDTVKLLQVWKQSSNKNTLWIVKHATRKIKVFDD